MAEILKKVEAEEENVRIALENLETVMRRADFSAIELAATATFLHNIYTGVENILKQVLKEHEIATQDTASWHKDLLTNAASIGILSEKTAMELQAYLGFRHFFVHGYASMLEEEPLRELGKKIPAIWSDFIMEVKDHLEKERTDKQSKLREKKSGYAVKRKLTRKKKAAAKRAGKSSQRR